MEFKVDKINHVRKAELLKFAGGSTHLWRIETDQELKEADAKAMQEFKGYSPFGYGFYDFRCIKLGDCYLSQWSCASHC